MCDWRRNVFSKAPFPIVAVRTGQQPVSQAQQFGSQARSNTIRQRQ